MRGPLPKDDYLQKLANSRNSANFWTNARNALARVSQHGSPIEKAKVRGAIHCKYPGIGKSKK
jgi:hypothetical protein